MGRVWRMRNLSFVALVAVAAIMLLLARGANEAAAAPYNPLNLVSLSTPAASAVADITYSATWRNSPTPSRGFPSSFAGFTPGTWGMVDTAAEDAAIPIGTVTGTALTTVTFGLLNSACAIPIAIPFDGTGGSTSLLDASTDGTGADTITPGAGFVDLIADVDDASGTYPTGISDGILDGAQHWNSLLTSLLGPLPPGEPVERQIATTSLFGTTIWVDLVTFSPGLLAPAALGFTTLLVVQNFSPVLPATPSTITDECGLRFTITQDGLAANGATHRVNPPPNAATGGTEIFFQLSTSRRDADQGPNQLAAEPTLAAAAAAGTIGFDNNTDTCPFTPNVGSPYLPVVGLDGDAGETATTLPAGFPAFDVADAIDAACDPDPTGFDGPDIDSDTFDNRDDNCPLVSNTDQATNSELAAGPPVDGGPPTDGIGDACDAAPHGNGRNPTVDQGFGAGVIDHTGVSDGHFHTVLNLAPICITFGGAFGGDPDGDGYCSASEGALGSNPAGAGELPGENRSGLDECSDGTDNDGDGLTDAADGGCSTPETLSIPTTCSDGVDNDGDGSADLADGVGGVAAPTGCQLPDHDLAIRKINGDSAINGGSDCESGGAPGCGVNIQIVNNNSVDESGQIGFLVDPIFGAGCSGPTAVLHGGSASPVENRSGPINVDGDNDIEFLLVVDVTIPANSKRTVNVGVDYPVCGPNVGTPSDYIQIVDLCHADDIAPLGLFALQGCGGAADGGQDRVSLSNDAPIIKVLNDLDR